tara:strand:- start:2031 stop:2849 length:819 start_codon:yes stop_codon:yes gene_type:complete
MKIETTKTTLNLLFSNDEIEKIKQDGVMTIRNANKKHFINAMVDQMMNIYKTMSDGEYANLFTKGNVIEEDGIHEYKGELNVIDRILENNRHYTDVIQLAKFANFKWKGLKLFKDPMSLTIYQQMLQDIKPKTILEFGSGEGGSASWFYDMTKTLGLDTRVITVDNQDIKEIPNVEFIKLDVNDIDSYEFEKYESPMLVIEDCHANMKGIINKVSSMMAPGDSLVIEDTIDPDKYAIFKSCDLTSFSRDSKYCDFWGKNNSWNYDSYLIKEK